MVGRGFLEPLYSPRRNQIWGWEIWKGRGCKLLSKVSAWSWNVTKFSILVRTFPKPSDYQSQFQMRFRCAWVSLAFALDMIAVADWDSISELLRLGVDTLPQCSRALQSYCETCETFEWGSPYLKVERIIFMYDCQHGLVAVAQGRDCLIQEFRNSSVMLEHVSFRPKVISSLVCSIQYSIRLILFQIFHSVGPGNASSKSFATAL